MSAATTFSDELDKLRRNICNDCKIKFVPGGVSNPAPSSGLNLSTATASDLPPVDSSGDSPNSSSIPAISLSNSETIPGITVDTSATNHDPEQTPSSPDPEFSVEYNPEVKRALTLHLEHVFAYESPALCLKISPDGQKLAVGFEDGGETIISDMSSRSNDRSVSEHLFSCLG